MEEVMDYRINVGAQAPQFSGEDQNGNLITDSLLHGQFIVLYFYPKDDTPGCTKEACSFRDNFARLQEFDATVLGVSPDNAESHGKFSAKHNLNFPLLVDKDLSICKAYDVLRTKEDQGKMTQNLERSTFLIDPEGKICWIDRPVIVEGHVDRVIEAMKALKPS
jgi:peroxiredoxin Q/BCP